jgi:hypothetical protein
VKTDFVDEPTADNTKPARKEWTEDDETRFVSLLEWESVELSRRETTSFTSSSLS